MPFLQAFQCVWRLAYGSGLFAAKTSATGGPLGCTRNGSIPTCRPRLPKGWLALINPRTPNIKEPCLVRARESGLDTVLRSEEHTSELQSPYDIVCRLLLEKKKQTKGDLWHNKKITPFMNFRISLCKK